CRRRSSRESAMPLDIFVDMTAVIPPQLRPGYAQFTRSVMSESFERTTIGEMVATDFRTARVFAQFGMYCCCGGRRSSVGACASAACDRHMVERALRALPPVAEDDDDVTQWTADRLIDHILTKHHACVRAALPSIGRQLAKLVEVHGQRHPELARV